MKFCEPHWQELKDAIRARGLWHLVASSSEAAFERAKAELGGKGTLATYDPLMAAHWAICSRAIELGGLYLLEGPYCPLCELDAHTKNPDGSKSDPPQSREWIKGVSDAVERFCIENGLRPRIDIIES